MDRKRLGQGFKPGFQGLLSGLLEQSIVCVGYDGDRRCGSENVNLLRQMRGWSCPLLLNLVVSSNVASASDLPLIGF
ncbi:hypothetical protein KC19_VG047700 [Ceratodon purpureus]|uniref:Uncharacterized protein n=1 Tax=Ceratodon purpureus TaxID=3225 RepID=A0A8T0HM17_CERPU|nr:hypothetical protein KC19_VG047700 [Ceratodon purpureus]